MLFRKIEKLIHEHLLSDSKKVLFKLKVLLTNVNNSFSLFFH
jgi:hypothetical protein